MTGNRLFTEFKGALAENYVCQALNASDKVTPRYWSAENSTGEVDFVYEWKGQIVPVEVKAEQNLRSKSLKAFLDRFHLERGIRLSLSGFEIQPWVTNVPLYAAVLLPLELRAACRLLLAATKTSALRLESDQVVPVDITFPKRKRILGLVWRKNQET